MKKILISLTSLFFLMALNGSASATHVSCGDRITVDTTLHENLLSCPGYGIIIGADDITLDGNGYTITGLGPGTRSKVGVYFNVKNGVTIRDLTVEQFHYVIYLTSSNDNILTGNTTSNNDSGLYLYRSSSNTLTNNTSSNNTLGIYLYSSSNNNIYNNNFISNRTQAYVYGDRGNIFNLAAPIGGNYWSDFDDPREGCVDGDSDGFCDDPYVINLSLGVQDNLPLTSEIRSPEEAAADLISDIERLGLPQGIADSLTSKLEGAIAAFEKGNDKTAINILNAFINAVEAQRGKKISDKYADFLIDTALWIIG